MLVAMHGAELTNMLLLPPGAAVIEVSLRYGWYCYPVPKTFLPHLANLSHAAPTSGPNFSIHLHRKSLSDKPPRQLLPLVYLNTHFEDFSVFSFPTLLN